MYMCNSGNSIPIIIIIIGIFWQLSLKLFKRQNKMYRVTIHVSIYEYVSTYRLALRTFASNGQRM